MREIGEAAGVGANRNRLRANQLHRGIKFSLTPTGNEDVSALLREQPGRGKADPRAAARDHCNFSFQLTRHDVLQSANSGVAACCRQDEAFTEGW
jgi:hypothetical protein